MANHQPLTTYPKPVQTNEDRQLDNQKVCFQAESIVHITTFPMVFKAALELGVIDIITKVDNDVWLSPSEIALGLPIKPTNPEAPVMLDRMLRLLASNSILKCRLVETGATKKVERVYAAEPVCKFFLNDSNGSGSFASQFMLLQSHISFDTWKHLKDLILEGKNAFSSAHGMECFEYMSRDKPSGELFNRAMSESSIVILNEVLKVYKGLENVNTLVNVAGGIGSVIGLITSKYPHIKGINFDLASVLANAPSYPGVEHIPGDMFVEVPKGDAIFIYRALHNWGDEDCVEILTNCWKSLPEKGKVVILDMVLPMDPKDDECLSNIVYSMDMSMLTYCPGGKERSFSELEVLASKSGFPRCEVICHVISNSVIEVYK